MNRHNVNRSIKKLIELGVILGASKSALAALTGLTLTSGGKAQPKAIGRLCTSTWKVIKWRGRRAHGAALATLPTCAHLSPDSQARLHRAGSVPCKPKTLKMSAYGFVSPYCATPKGSCQHRGRCPHPRSPRGRGAGKNLLHPLPQSVGSPPTCKRPSRYAVASQALTGFQLKSASVGFATPRRWRGSRATKSCIYPWRLGIDPTLTVGVGG